MIVFVREDAAYRAWVARHRGGFVLDWRRDARRGPPRLHRADCADVRPPAGRRTLATSGSRARACALDPAELSEWARGDIGRAAVACERCTPDTARPPTATTAARDDPRPTRLGREIVDTVVEAAVIHLDRRDGGYRWTVAGVARAVGKTPAQIRTTVERLIADGLLEGGGEPMSANTPLFPTARSLRTLPAFATVADEQLEAELADLGRATKGVVPMTGVRARRRR